MLDREAMYLYQDKGSKFIQDKGNCALWVDVGLGKTVTALTAYADLRAAFSVRRALVAAPLRVARQVWSDEVDNWSHLKGLHVAHIIGTPAERMKALRTPADIHTINREQIPWLEAQFLDGKKQLMRWPWDLVMPDEAQFLKDQSSQRWKAMSRLRPLFPRMVQLTGGPTPNGYGDLWAQMNLLDGGRRLGTSEQAFTDRWFTATNYGSFSALTLRDRAADEIKAAVADIVLSLKEEDYLDLPPVICLFHKVQLSGAAMRTYREMAREYTVKLVGGRTLTAVNAGVLDGKLLQLANGVVYTGEGREVVEFHDEKLQALEELLDAITGKALVAYYFLHDLDRVKRLLEASGRRWKVLRTDPDFREWAAGGLDVGLIHPASAGEGLNELYKPGVEDLIHYGLTANYGLYKQVNGRLTGGHRRQGRNVKIHHIVAEHTRDEDYVKILSDKASSQDDLTRSLALRVATS